MSAFLGPIHEKMYRRVLAQDSITGALLDLAEEKGWGDLRPQVDAAAPAADRRPLEDIIDPQNIHGWLSEAVAQCERRYALAVRAILEGHPQRLETLAAAMGALGRDAPLPAGTDARQAFETVHSRLLDGMPCDFPFAMGDTGPDAVHWQVVSCPHAPYWEAGACGVETYYHLRDAWLEGALANSGLSHSRTAPFTHTLRKEPRHG